MDRNEVLLKELSRILKEAITRSLPKRLKLTVDRDLLEVLYLRADTAMKVALSRIPEVIANAYYYVEQYESERDFFCQDLADKTGEDVQQIKYKVDDFVDEVGAFLYNYIQAWNQTWSRNNHGPRRAHRVKERTS